MKKIIIGIYGASGYGKEVMPLVQEQIKSSNDECELIFIDDDPATSMLLNHAVVNFEEFMAIEGDKHVAVIAIGESSIRKILTEKCLVNDVKLLDIKASNVIILEDVQIGDGFILNPFVTLTSDIRIGKSFQANIYSYVAHDCVIGDYVTFAPGVKCNGNIEIGDHAYIGTGAILKQGKPGFPLVIGEGAIVGAGSMVTKSVPAGMTVFGNPAIELTKENLARRR